MPSPLIHTQNKLETDQKKKELKKASGAKVKHLQENLNKQFHKEIDTWLS